MSFLKSMKYALPSCHRHRQFAMLFGFGILLAACSQETEPLFVELSSQPATPQTIYVTPTQIPTNVPTVAPLIASATSAATPQPVTPTTVINNADVSCDVVLELLYENASNLCLGKPDGYFCNGGLPPRVEPAGPVSSALGSPGALVEAQVVDSVHTSPLPSNNSGGMIWVRLNDFVQLDGLLIGDVSLQDVTPDNPDFPAWQALMVETGSNDATCDTAPPGAFIVQSPYGQSSRVVLNGASIDLNGTLVIQTENVHTEFIMLEGQSQVKVFGQPYLLYAGQQLTIAYHPGDFTAPAGIIDEPHPLDFWRIAQLPTILLDRTILLPQPGYVGTEGLVNMRAKPNINSRLLFQVPADEIMSVLGSSPDNEWFHIRLGNGETGWMKADLLAQNIGIIENRYDSTPVPPQRYGDLGSRARVDVGQGGNLREAPDTSFPILNTLPFGQEVELVARSPYSPWVKVESAGNVGWMALITLDTQAVISSLPIEYDVPLPSRATSTPFYSYGGGHAYPDPNSGN